MMDYGDFCNELRKGLKEQIALLNETSHGCNEVSLEEFTNNLLSANIKTKIISSSEGFHHSEIIIPLSHNIILKISEKQNQDSFDVTINYEKSSLKIKLANMSLQQQAVGTIKDLYLKCEKNAAQYESVFKAETTRKIKQQYEGANPYSEGAEDYFTESNDSVSEVVDELKSYLEELIENQTQELKEYIDEKIESLLKKKSSF